MLVDTIDTLYTSYLNILEMFGAIGTIQEFDFLNGKNVEEIAKHLTGVHRLPCSESELIALFQEKFDSLYADVELMPGAQSILAFLQLHDARIALASSSSRRNINVILNRFELGRYFELIVSGDDVQNAKPSPDIYNLVKNHFKTNRCFVVEDSSNGLLAARSAGLITVFFSPQIPTGHPKASFVVRELRDIEQIAGPGADKPILISTCANVKIESSPIKGQLTDAVQADVDRIWQSESRKNPTLFNGQIVCYVAHHVTADDTIVIKTFVSEYKYVIAQLQDRSLNCVRPLAVSGFVVDKNQNVLIGKRSNHVAEYPGLLEFVPSGGISAERLTGNGYKEQLVVELEEETGIPASCISKMFPIGLIFDPKHDIYDLALLVELGIEIDLNRLKSSEYSSFSLLNVHSLNAAMTSNPGFVSTGRAIYSAWSELAGRLQST